MRDVTIRLIQPFAEETAVLNEARDHDVESVDHACQSGENASSPDIRHEWHGNRSNRYDGRETIEPACLRLLHPSPAIPRISHLRCQVTLEGLVVIVTEPGVRLTRPHIIGQLFAMTLCNKVFFTGSKYDRLRRIQ